MGVSAHRIAHGLTSFCEVDVLHMNQDLEAGMVRQQERGRLRIFTLGEAEDQAECLQLMEQVSRSLHDHRHYHALIGFYAVPVGTVAVMAARQMGLPSVVSLRGNDVDRAFYHSGRSGLLQWTLAQATKLVAVSTELQKKTQAISGRQDVLFLPNAVDSDQFYPVEFPASPESELLFVGEMRFKKGLAVLLNGLEELEGDWRLTLAGGLRPEASRRLQLWKGEFPHLAQRVREVRYRRDPAHLRELYNRADLVVNPALWEGMPNSLLEAMACGRPVLATAVGGVLDLVQDKETGWLVKPDQCHLLGERIQAALNDPERAAIGMKGRERVKTHHQPEQEATRYWELLTDLVKT